MRPDSSDSRSEDDVVIGSMDYPPTSNNPGNFDAHDEIFQIGDNTHSVADVSVSQVHLEERKEAQIIKLNLRSNTLPPTASIPAGVSSKGRGRLQGSVAIAVRDMDSESRPETQNSDRTVVNNGQPDYITSEKADLKQKTNLQRDAIERMKVISRI